MTDGEPKRVALVTGAASGIGAAIATRLRSAGHLVAGIDLSESDTDLSLVADVSDREGVASAARRAEAELGPVDVLVSGAGHYEMLALADIDDARWQRMLSVHLGGAVNTVAAVLPGMLARGRGTIVTISSELALGGGDHDAHYAAAKGALIGFTKSLAAEVAPSGIRVNSVAPGSTDTPLLEDDSPWRAREYADTLPLRRIVAAEEIAETVAFLVEEGSFFVGQVLSPNAGAVI
ncbi:MAG: 2-hydroxycyclohexanecarboxyl-CoA dehydrogenase [Thermoleophilales bacterium]|nr:2-hydroxycyclohexanecarboxyl-CoA dehydrogenase [Thermoleophilales bacterium]